MINLLAPYRFLRMTVHAAITLRRQWQNSIKKNLYFRRAIFPVDGRQNTPDDWGNRLRRRGIEIKG
jgi:hypothetical protein